MPSDYHEEFIDIYNQNLEYMSELDSLLNADFSPRTFGIASKTKAVKPSSGDILLSSCHLQR